MEVVYKAIRVEVEVAAKKFAYISQLHRAAKMAICAIIITRKTLLKEYKGKLNSPASFSKVPKGARMAMHALGIMQKT